MLEFEADRKLKECLKRATSEEERLRCIDAYVADFEREFDERFGSVVENTPQSQSRAAESEKPRGAFSKLRKLFSR